MVDSINVPSSIAAVIFSGRASYVELDSVLGLEDLHDLLELIAVDGHNKAVMRKIAASERD